MIRHHFDGTPGIILVRQYSLYNYMYLLTMHPWYAWYDSFIYIRKLTRGEIMMGMYFLYYFLKTMMPSVPRVHPQYFQPHFKQCNWIAVRTIRTSKLYNQIEHYPDGGDQNVLSLHSRDRAAKLFRARMNFLKKFTMEKYGTKYSETLNLGSF